MSESRAAVESVSAAFRGVGYALAQQLASVRAAA
mgnify:CR=1 FL=1